jgi:hypothetical protein
MPRDEAPQPLRVRYGATPGWVSPLAGFKSAYSSYGLVNTVIPSDRRAKNPQWSFSGHIWGMFPSK